MHKHLPCIWIVVQIQIASTALVCPDRVIGLCWPLRHSVQLRKFAIRKVCKSWLHLEKCQLGVAGLGFLFHIAFLFTFLVFFWKHQYRNPTFLPMSFMQVPNYAFLCYSGLSKLHILFSPPLSVLFIRQSPPDWLLNVLTLYLPLLLRWLEYLAL